MGRITFFHLSIWGFLVSCFVLQGTEAYSCPPDWINIQRHCYSLKKVPRKWNDAETDCQTYGTKSPLASILSEGEHRRLAAAITAGNDLSVNIWIGLFRMKKGGKIKHWRWTDNAVVGYMPWGPGQPSNCRNEQYCVELYGVDFMDLNDNNCDTENFYICKMPL
nr:C-type lectin PAL-like [Zootoca vivipara]